MFTSSTWDSAVKRVLAFAQNGSNGVNSHAASAAPAKTNGHPPPPVEIKEGPSIETVASAAEQPAELLSVSQVKCWLSCQAKWYYKYLVGLTESRNSNLGLGSAVDRALSWQFSEKAVTRQDKPASEVMDAFTHEWEEESAEIEFQKGEDPEKLAGVGRGLVERYMDELAPDVQPALIGGEPAVQHHVSGVIAGVKVHGYIDIVDEQGVVIDLKTARSKPPGVPANDRLQVVTYGAICEECRGQGRLEYMIKNKVPKTLRQTVDITPEEIRFAESVYPMAQEAMRDGIYTPNRAANYCSRKNCSYWQRCQEDFGGTVE